MYCVCYVCGIQYRKKRPFNDRRVSHRVCDDCFPVEMGRIKGELALLNEGEHGELSRTELSGRSQEHERVLGIEFT